MTTRTLRIPLAGGTQELLPRSEDYWPSLLKNAVGAIESDRNLRSRGKYQVHSAVSKAIVYLFSLLNHCSIDYAAEELNALVLAMESHAPHFFKDGRQRRAFPHQTDVNTFLREVGPKRALKIAQESLDRQLVDALSRNLVRQRVVVIFDFNKQAYFGQRDDKAICGTTRQRGTKKMRHYLHWMVVSGKVHLFAGMHLVKVGESKIPIVETALEHLAALRFEIATVLWDREFYRAELVDAVKSTGADMLMPAKIYMRVAALIDEYLAGSRGRVMKYTFSTSTANTQRIAVRAWLVLGATKQQNLGAIRRACQSGLLPASEARKNIYAFLVVRRPRSRAGSWESKLSRQYKGRWQLETVFSDKNQLAPRWRTNIDHERLLGEIGRCLIYNAWQLMAAGERQQSARERPVRLREGIDALKRAVQIYILQDRMKGVKLTQ